MALGTDYMFKVGYGTEAATTDGNTGDEGQGNQRGHDYQRCADWYATLTPDIHTRTSDTPVHDNMPPGFAIPKR